MITSLYWDGALAMGLGLLMGGWHFGSLRWFSAQLLKPKPRPGWQLAAVQVLRLALLGGVGWGVARQGPVWLLCWALGLLLARAGWLARERRQAAVADPVQRSAP